MPSLDDSQVVEARATRRVSWLCRWAAEDPHAETPEIVVGSVRAPIVPIAGLVFRVPEVALRTLIHDLTSTTALERQQHSSLSVLGSTYELGI